MEQNLKLWGFLHAFQQSPYQYLYFRQVVEALEQIHHFTREDLIAKLSEMNSGYGFWTERLVHVSDEVARSEEKYLRPEFKLVFYGQKDFPLNLRMMDDPPLALSYSGDLSSINSMTLSVVGSREPHEFSSEWMQKELYGFLKLSRACVISGGARGVDQKAHFMAALLDLPTAVVLPSGLAEKYPAVWQESHWKEKSVVFVSEMRLGEKISKKNFSSRNRLIAAWGLATLVVEAHRKSGTLITAHHALAAGKPVWVVPCHPQLSQFAGSLDLLVEHADLVRNAFDMSNFFEAEAAYYTKPTLGLG